MMRQIVRRSLKAMLFFSVLTLTCLLVNGDAFAKEEQNLSFVEIARSVKPSVVNIYTVSKDNSEEYEKYHNDEKNRNFFRDFFDKYRNKDSRGSKKNLGSGVIIDKNGYILTNNHIVEGSTLINVSLASGEEYEARLIGKDIKTDLALIKINSNRELPAAKLGNSEKLEVGEWVMAIGNPYGLEETVTVGIVSAKGRVVGAGPYDNFIQTDSPINPGNSGGPLVNTRAEVVGINTLIFKGVQNLGFAIPVNLAREIFTQLKKSGKVVRGWLGVYIQKVVPEMLEFFQLKEPRGALVSEVTPEGPADKAGIETGDVIMNFDGVEIGDANDLPLIVARRPVGKKVKVNVLRDGKIIDIPVVLGELNEDEITKIGEKKSAGILLFGMRVEYLDEREARNRKIGETSGVYVVDVNSSGQAFDKGVKKGDIILEVNRIAVDNIEELKEAVKKNERGVALILLKRGKNTFFVTLESK